MTDRAPLGSGRPSFCLKYRKSGNFRVEKFLWVKFLFRHFFVGLITPTLYMYKKLTRTQTSEKQVVPSCVEQQCRSLKDFVVFEATNFIKMSGKLLLEKCWRA